MSSKRVLLISCLTAICAGCSSPRSSAIEVLESSAIPREPNTVQDIDICIQDLQEQKERYEARRLFASREANRLLTLDWLMYRRYTADAERCTYMIQEIDKEIARLQQKKIELQQRQ